MFSETQYVFSVSENAIIGTLLTPESPSTGIIATDDEADTITFEKIDLSDSTDITLDPNSGELLIAQLLDREIIKSYSFEIRANDGISRGILFLPTVTVQIVVLDVNDNMPVFVNSPYSFTIEEGVSDGHQVNPSDGKISVTDSDLGNNQPSEFSIISGHDDRFTIDQNGIIITTLDDSAGVERIIDYESKQVYNIVVRATNTEDGPSGAVFSQVDVTISILNINDEDPIFSPSSVDQSISISEATLGVIITLEAVDTDDVLSTPTTFTYSIVYGNNLIDGLHSFAIDPSSGAVSVDVTNLDHETHGQYVLVIQAEEDQSPKSSVLTSLTVNIQDSNEFPPVFTQSNYGATISEASDVNSAVILVLADDTDPSHTVSYSLDGSVDSMIFSIDSATGLIILLASVDRETKDVYTFEVIAVDDDPSPISATATVTISVSDENDNSPTFAQAEQEISHDEQVSVIPVVIYNVASQNIITDIDEGVNTQVKYSFQTGDSAFSIDPDTGLLSVVAVLDFNTQSVYKLTIIATDQAVLASERRSGSFVLTVTVNDINDNSPVLASIGAQTIEENLPAESIVFTVSATDLDQGLTTPLSLSIMEGASVPFSINSVGTPTKTFISAHISTTRPFDFETVPDKSFSLTIEVSDGINTQSEIVIVTTEDTNDNSPVFSQTTGYSFDVDEIETGTIIGLVAATDVDTSIFGPITYVKTGDNEDYFQLDSTTGDISIQIGLDAESLNIYRFSIVAFDSGLPPLSEIVLVTINVLDFNDNAPIFLISHVEVSIDENTGTSNIFTFIANDNDRDSPNNVVNYFIIDSFPVISDLTSLFVIGLTSGTIQTGVSLPNREDFVEITLTIEARDQGSFVMSDLATITIYINDLNDNMPSFEFPSYSITVDEDFSTSETLIQVQAFESPEDANTQITYSLQNSLSTLANPLEFVTIDSGTGVITAAKSLDFEVLNLLFLTITASDGTNEDTAAFTVTVDNINDNDPSLTISTCSQSLPEDLPLGAFCTLNVMDLDQDSSTPDFTLESSGFSISPSLTEFAILYSDGSLTASVQLQSLLDFESVKSYPLVITIVDRGRPSARSATLSLPLIITGINEHAPVFSLPEYTFYMDETEEISSIIGKVTATDADDSSTSDGIFIYTVEGVTSPFPFTLESSSGVIKLNTKVDYEQDTSFIFDVHATDNAGGSQLTGSTIVTILVVDSNEHPPIFSPFTPPEISENIGADVLVVQVTASDDDRNDVISYSIIDGNYDSVFRIDTSSGEIFTTNISPDFEVYPSYLLIVRADDNALNSREASTAVSITILDANDNSPVFDRPPVDSIVDEEIMAAFIMLVSATDLDSDSNAMITYSVLPDTEFTMDATTGILTTKIALDREVTSSYSPEICATDGGSTPLSVCQLVTITIADVNDHFPIFLATSVSTVNIPENTNGGQRVSTFSVTDQDENPTFFFTLQDGGGPFSISSSGATATVTISGDSGFTPLDRESVDMYSLIVTVTDGITAHIVPHTFDVIVTDINDEIPSFTTDTYIVSDPLPEDTSDGTSVVTVEAVDNDIHPNNILTFSLLESADNRFRVDSTTGDILVNIESGGSILDFESLTSHTLIVESSDGTLTDTAIVFIPIGDVNDNDPNFLESSYSIQVLETTAVGTTILAVQAVDIDSGPNGEIKYFIDSTDIDVTTTFEIAESTGILTTILLLDADSVPTEYTFQIRAQDSSTILVRSSFVSVLITVLGQNEDIPEFSSTLYTETILEGINEIANVLTVSASETDSSAMISYDIVDSGAKYYFNIDPMTGILSLINPLDREEFEDFTFTVVASDSDSPPRQGFSSVKILITDVNDNHPIFLLSQYSVTISENTIGVILTITATDSDATIEFSEISYAFSTSVSPFTIDPTSGEISVSGALDFDQGLKSYSISIIATDDDFSGITNLNIQLTDENDIAPLITNSDFSITISESAPGGTEVFDLNIQDIDTVGTITYQILSGNTDNSFIIDSSGIVTISATGLDFESIASFSLNLEVSDGSQQATSTLTVTVTDINDHVPTFDQSQYTMSIMETDLPDTTVLSFTILDPDTGDDGKISVFIDSSSNTVNMFKLKTVTTNSFEILSAIDLDRETSGLSIDNSLGSAKWILKVVAYDNNIIISERLTSTAEILITLQDVNDNTPQFSSNSYSAQISESSNIGTLVITLNAIDLDFGTNAVVTYRFAAASMNTDSFNIDATTGELRTSSVLSRENSATLVLTVEATDGVNADSAIVTITITDINDHNPVFDVALITASINENSFVGTSVADVSASDLDDGDNGRISILIIGGDPNSQFKINNINSATAQVQVAKDDIDRELQSNYELILAAQDHGTPTRQGTATILISILDVNDNSPVFSPSEYFGSISEVAMAGTSIILNTPIIFSDLDDGLNSQVSLSLDSDTIFSISSSYVISLNPSISLDREDVSSYEIHIVAIDMGNPSLTSSATLSIFVEDVNDNSPIFSPLTYSASLNEIVSIGTSITTVFASDSDSGANMEVSYHIFSGSQGNFDVDLASGIVRTTASLDRELTDSYDLVIIAFDSGSPFMTSTAPVSIMIEDANDNIPIFSQSLYTGSVDENDSGSGILVLAASDSDINDNAVLFFDFLDPIAGSILPFSIDSMSGEISVTGSLDRESTDIYSFEVVVRDNAIISLNRLTATANVVITINDLNDVAPFFPGVDSLRTSIQETTQITTIILSPIATDPDLGNGGDILYSLLPLSTIFSADENTGEIQLIQSLDVDSTGPNGQSEYQFTFTATDRGTPPLSGSIPIIISVLNENDNVPIFDSPLYNVAVPEDNTVGTSIITLIATDSDISGTIKYDIVGGNLDLLFSIDEDSGIVTNVLPLLNLSNKIFELTVRAYESGDNSKFSLTSLHIEISDTNDNAPTFCQTADYQFSVDENSPIGTSIGQICGSDTDTGINGEFSFRIDTGNDKTAFQIEQLSGSSTAYITVANAILDRESDDEYTLLLFITDNGIPQLQSSPIVASITILDVNDETPTLDNLPFSIEILEDAFGGTSVYQVVGSDSDSALNADIFFEITDGNNGGLFRIEPETGIITIIASLNFNTQSQFLLTIQVSDKGSPPLIAQSTLEISIIDVNNNAPLFMPPYEISISEALQIASFIISVEATDQDATTNAELTYSISSGVNAVHFAIDNNGDITLNNDLDRETQSSYSLVVTACDMGTPKMCTDTQVTITISDNNDHEPIFSQPIYSFTVLEDRSADFKIGKVIATDLDEGVNGDVTYIFVSGDSLFSIDSEFGDVMVDGELDRETSDFYQLIIRAEDNGNPMLTAIATVDITVLDVNDNSPIIDVSVFSSQISEDARIGDVVFDVDVTDLDQGTNARITLSILGGDFGDFFIIPDTGSIHVNNSLSAEKILQYELLIQASDSADPPLTDIQTLIIDIIDVNEFPPNFGQAVYFANLLENSPAGTIITTVTASDVDVQGTVNSQISFFIPNLYSLDFSVDSVTGRITSITSFNREDSASQVLFVMASNPNAIPILLGSAEIRITIIDVNDEIPYFINVPVNIEISELSPVGLSVLTLEALDDDDPNLGNGRVIFSGASENTAEFDRSFRINSNGLLEVNGILDRENQQVYTAVAVVSDEGEPRLSSTTIVSIVLLDENDNPPLFSNSFYPISYSEDLDPSSQNGLSRLLLTLDFTDGDSDVIFQQSMFRISSNSPFSTPEFSVTDGGELFLNIGVDRELLDTYTIFVEVINIAIGLGAYCSPLDKTRALNESDQCRLYHNSTVQITVTDINDNTPIFSSSPFYFAILDTASFNSEVGIVIALDSDLSNFGDIIFSLSGTSDFVIDDSSGLLRTNVIFSGRVGQFLMFTVTASDLAVTDPRSSSETVFVSVIDNQYLIQIVVDQTVEDTLLCLDQLVNKLIQITQFQILVFDVREHFVDLIVNPLQTDVLIYGLQVSEDSFALVPQSELIRKIDENFVVLTNICDAKVQTVSLVVQVTQPVTERRSSSVQIILIITVCVIILLCGLFANFLALYQRILGKRNLQRTEEYIYGGMEGLDVLTTTQQGVALSPNTHLSDTFPLGMTYESQELKMDLFLDEIPEEEFISGSEITSIVNGDTLLAAALDTPTHDDHDISISSI